MAMQLSVGRFVALLTAPVLLGAVALAALGTNHKDAHSTALAPTATAIAPAWLILRPRHLPLSGVLANGTRFTGSIYPGYPGVNTLRLVLPGGASRPGRVTLVGTMPGMAMTPVRASLRWDKGAYGGTLPLAMFGTYRVRLSLSAPSLPAAGAMAITLPLPHP